MKLAAAGLWICLILSANVAHASGTPRDFSTYVEAIHTLRVELDVAARSSTPNEAAVRRVQTSLKSLAFVRLPGAGVIETDLPQLAGQIDPKSVSSVRRAVTKLRLLEVQLGPAVTNLDAGAALSALPGVYASPAFHHPQTLGQRLGGWIYDHFGQQIAQFVTWIRNATNVDVSPIAALLSAVLVVLGVLGLAHLYIRGTLKRMTVPRKSFTDEETGLSDSEALLMARDSALAGDTRIAFRYLFLSVLLDLQRRGLVTLHPGWTNRDHLSALASTDEALSHDLRQLVDAFDRVWYGHEMIDDSAFRRLEGVAMRLMNTSIAA